MTDELMKFDQTLQEQIRQRKNAEDRFEALLEASPCAVIIINSENKIAVINSQTEQLFGYTRDQLLGQSVQCLIPERYHASYMANLHHVRVGTDLELYACRKDGSEFPAEVTIKPFVTEGDTMTAIHIRDCTRQDQLINALAEERRLLYVLMDNLPDLIYFKDTGSHFTRINRAHAEMLGADSPNDAIGKTDFDFQRSELSKAFLEEEAQIIQSGEPLMNREEFNPETDGTPRWYSTTKVPIKDLNGHVTGIVGISHDITLRKQMEEALRNSEEEFHSTFAYASIGMALVGLDGQWLQVNKAGCEIVGYSEMELLGKTFQDITHPDDLDMSLNYTHQLLAGDIPFYQTEKRYLRKGGDEVWVLLNVSLVRDSQEKPLHFVAQIQDITGRKWTEAALTNRLQDEQEFQTHLRALHSITMELTAIEDLDHFYKRAVELGLEHLGFDRIGFFLYDPEQRQVTGTYGTDIHGQLTDEHHLRFASSDLTGILQRAYQRADHLIVEENVPLYNDLQPVARGWNAVGVLWNGTEKFGWLAIDNAIHHQPITQPVLDILSLYALAIGTLLGQKRVQLALFEQRNLLRTIIDTLPDQVFLKDRQSRFILVNRATFQSLGASRAEDVLGKTDFDFVTPEIAERLFEEEQSLLEANRSRLSTEGWVGRPEGHEVYLSTIKVPLRDAHGHITGLLGTNRDMTERRQLESVLVEKEKLQAALDKEHELSQLKSRMMERISHEFRTPLTIIQLTTETITTYFDRLRPEQRAEKSMSIQRATQRLTDMLDGISRVIHDVPKGEALHRFQLNLRYIIDTCAYELERQLNLPEKFVLNIPGTIMLEVDREIIKEALFPVLRNAARYSAPESPVILELFHDETGIELRITDHGIGIAPNELPRVFDPFFRGSNINEIGGLGIGLTLAQRAVEAHKGTLTVESVLGQGTTVKLWLPNKPDQ